MSRPRRGLLPRAAVAAGTLLVSLLALEFLVRASRIGTARDGLRLQPLLAAAAEDPGRYRRHPRRVYELAPGYRFDGAHAGREALGDWPYRGPPAEPAPPGLLRVAVLGDSCVYGAGLDSADTLPARLAAELAAHGLGPREVLVLNFGVPGYSTAQLVLLLEEVIQRWAPDAFVLYPAAWNDQAPVVWKDDATLLAELADPPLGERLRSASALVDWTLGRLTRPREEILAGWRGGDPPLGWRVPAEGTEVHVRELLSRCRAAGGSVVLVAPAHPPATREGHPRTATDAETVARVGTEEGVPLVLAQALLSDALLPLERAFVDYVHLSPEGTAVLARAVAGLLLPDLRARHSETSPPAEIALVSVEPRRACSLGDLRLRVRLRSPWNEARPPSLLVGGAPLLDVVVRGAELEGLLAANAPGVHDLVLLGSEGVGVLPEALELVAPTLSCDGERLVFQARVEDRCRVFAAPRARAVPHWSPRGAWWLPEQDLQELSEVLVAGPDGTGVWLLPPGFHPAGAQPLVLQGWVLPAGPRERLLGAARVTPLLRLE